MSATTFWSPDGKLISAAQFIEKLYGDLPDLFKDEDELRALWCKPDTRKKLLTGLDERGDGRDELNGVRDLINAEKSDLFDVLSYIAFVKSPVARQERVDTRKAFIFDHYDAKQQEFLSFALDHYVDQGVEELDQSKMASLLELKYDSIHDAVAELEGIPQIRDLFIGFQEYLYVPMVA